jgi:hypothetical protein
MIGQVENSDKIFCGMTRNFTEGFLANHQVCCVLLRELELWSAVMLAAGF